MKASALKYIAAVAFSAMSALVVGCGSLSTHDHDALDGKSLEDVRASSGHRKSSTERPVVALVLGGGGLRGFAHVGVLRALEDAGIQPDIVVGTSAGAVVGAAYASGLSSSQIEDAAQRVKLSSLVDLTLSSSGVIRGDKLASWVDEVTRHQPIESFPIRFAAVATDLQSQRVVVLEHGAPGRAVQASAAVPGINVPVPYSDGRLIDGGVASLIPVRVARAMGADLVIAVDIYCNEPLEGGLSAPSVLFRVMHSQSCAIGRIEAADAHILIAPAVGPLKLSDKEQQYRAVEAGFWAAQASLSALQVRMEAAREATAAGRQSAVLK